MCTDYLDEESKNLYLLNNKDKSSITKQIELANTIYDSGIVGETQLLNILLKRFEKSEKHVNGFDGFVFELLSKSKHQEIVQILKQHFTSGIVSLKSDYKIDYLPLQKLLIEKNFRQADQLTQQKLCELSQKCSNHYRNWLYFTDIFELPSADLITIDKLWSTHSQELFGISIQRRIWLENNSDWDKLWQKIGWTINNQKCRYPQDFIWTLKAPAGHLPLFNQLRGVQVLASLFNHPVWHSDY